MLKYTLAPEWVNKLIPGYRIKFMFSDSMILHNIKTKENCIMKKLKSASYLIYHCPYMQNLTAANI